MMSTSSSSTPTTSRRLAALAIGLSALVLGCTGGAPPAPPKPPPSPKAAAPSPVESDPLVAGPTGFFRSKRFDLRIPFPDGAGFKIDDTRAPWLVARHEASRSTVVVRRWREADIVSHDACEAKARAMRSLPTLDDAEIIETRSLAVPPDHDTTATAALIHAPAPKSGPKSGPSSSPGGPPPLYGVVLAFGGFAHECFAYAFVTEADGRDAESIVAARLVRIMDGALARIDTRSDLDPSLERDGRPPR